MFVKVLGFGAPVLLGGLYVTGALGAGGWSRDVGRPPAEVMRALEDLDIRDQPGALPADIARSGTASPVIRFEQNGNAMRWVVMNGNTVTLTMVADFTPIDGGKRTHITAHVERGDAPDDHVAPAFRSKGVALGLFSTALEGQLNDLSKPAYASLTRDPDGCARLFRQFQEENLAASAHARSDGPGSAAATATRLRAYDAQQRQLGCQHADGSSDVAPGEIAASDSPGEISSPESGTAQPGASDR